MNTNGYPIESTAVVITAGDSPAAFDIVRSLGRTGVKTAVASPQRNDIAHHSRFFAGAIQLLALVAGNDHENLERLIGFAWRQAEKPVLFYASDPELSFVRRNRAPLGRWFRFLLPDEFVLECLFNKVMFSSFASAYRLPVPATAVVHEAADLPAEMDGIEFPCIVKPAFSEDWQWETEEQLNRFGSYKEALHRIGSPAELSEFCNALPKRQSGFLIQRYIEGRDESIVSFHGYFDEDSKCLGYFAGRKIRTFPPHTGGSTYVQTYRHTSLVELSIRYLQRIRFRGIVKIDYKWDDRENEFKILEINPRYNLWEVLGAYAGVNLVYIAYCHQRGMKIPEQTKYRENVRLLYAKQDLRSFLRGYLPLGEWSVWRYVSSLMHEKVYRVFDGRDMKPFIFSLYGFLTRNLLRLFFSAKDSIVHPQREAGMEKIANRRPAAVYDEAYHG